MKSQRIAWPHKKLEVLGALQEKDIAAIKDFKKDCKIIQIGRAENFQDGNITKIEPCDKLILRACAFGKPERSGGVITVNGKFYKQ